MVAPAVSPDPETVSDKTDITTLSPIKRLGPVLLRMLLAAASGVLLYLSFPPRDLWWLAPIGFAGLYWVLRGRKARAGFGYGFVAGLGFMLPLLWWTGKFVGLVASIPLTLTEAVLMAVATAAIAVVSTLPAAPLWAALLWVAGETLRALVPFGGFPWAKIAFGQPGGLFIPLAAIGGTPLVAAAVSCCGFGLAELLRRLAVNRRRRPATAVVPALAAVLPLIAGIAASTVVSTAPEAGTVTVAAVQGNVPRAGLDFEGQRRAVLDNHVKRTLQLADDIKAGRVPKPDLVIWPENSSDVDPYRDPVAWSEIDNAVKAVGVPVAVGAVLIGDDGLPRNTIILWDPQQGPINQYTKRKLQPFGETMPMRSFFRLFTSEVDRAGNFVPGDKATVFAMGKARVALDTCYEVAFDSVVRDSVLNGSNLLAVPTNNATFGFTDMTYQQLGMDRVRAVEHGRSVVVAATSGVSAIIRPDGSVIQQTSLFTPAALVQQVPLRTTTTVADRLGALPEWVMVAGGLVALVVGIEARRRARTRASAVPVEIGESEAASSSTE